MNHPDELDLALLAGGDVSRMRRFTLEHHVRSCSECAQKMAQFRGLRAELANFELPNLNWNSLASEMRANIHVGLEAGACVRSPSAARGWNPRLTLAFASLLLIVGSSFLLRNTSLQPNKPVPQAATPVIESSDAGIELRSGSGSLMLLNRPGAASNQTVSAGGEIRVRNVDGETGVVTINNVSLE